MANTLITPEVILKESLIQLENNLVMANKVYRDYEAELVDKKVGDFIQTRRPVQYEVKDGPVMQMQDTLEASGNFQVNNDKHVALNFSYYDMSLKIEDFSERYIRPACIQLANAIDASLCDQYKKIWFAQGTPGTAPNSYATVSPAAVQLGDVAVPDDGNRMLVTNEEAGFAIAGGVSGLASYQPSEATGAFKSGRIGKVATFDLHRSQNIKRHTNGNFAGTPLVRGAGQSVTYQVATANRLYQQTLPTDGWTGGRVLEEGDLFTINGVFEVNPVSKASTGRLQKFVVRETVTTNANSANETAIVISPPIIVSGPYQTVTNAPADDAPITYIGTSTQIRAENLAFHKNAFQLAMVKLFNVPAGAVGANKQMLSQSYKGLTLNLMHDMDINNRAMRWRLDAVWAADVVDPRLACRLLG